jgi:hypothetical protein
MKVPVDLFLSAIEEKRVYYFSSAKINTTEPHHYICVKRTPDDLLIMSCCTSQEKTITRFLDKRGLSYQTIVYIKPAADNPFTMDTYINCNEFKEFSIAEFRALYQSEAIEHSGEISEVTYGQIIVGMHESPLIEDEIKEILPPRADYV